MGIGDDIIATSFAKGAKYRGELIAFGNGQKIIWGPYSEMIFKSNPNIARPGQERLPNVKWVNYYKGHRIYNTQGNDRWIWNYQFHVTPGEIFLGTELPWQNNNLIIIEPNVPKKRCAPNKQWPIDRWHFLVKELTSIGLTVKQLEYGASNQVAEGIQTKTFQNAVYWLTSARLAILPEGGLHHAAAAVGTPAVVLFGGFVPPSVLGYDSHINLTGGAVACGSFGRCEHCIDAMNNITVDEVIQSVRKILNG